MIDGVPAAQRWSLVSSEWRGILMPFDLDPGAPKSAPPAPVWRCPHRHPSKGEAEDCAGKRRGARHTPRRVKKRASHKGGLMDLLLGKG